MSPAFCITDKSLVPSHTTLSIIASAVCIPISAGTWHAAIIYHDKIRIGSEVSEELYNALAQGRNVTAKVRWIPKPGDQGLNRWIAFTPLIGGHKQIGVWIAILLEDELANGARRKQAPPIKFRIGARNQDPPPSKPAPSAIERSLVTPDADRTSEAKEVVMPDQGGRMSKELPPTPSRKVPGIDPSITTLVPEIDEHYETLEERLRKKRERDAARLLEQPNAPVKATYKSLSPYAFMNNDRP